MQKMRANGLRCCWTVTTQCTPWATAASQQGRPDLVQNAVFTEGTNGALIPGNGIQNGLTNFKHWKRTVGGIFALDCYGHQGIRKIANRNTWLLKLEAFIKRSQIQQLFMRCFEPSQGTLISLAAVVGVCSFCCSFIFTLTMLQVVWLKRLSICDILAAS